MTAFRTLDEADLRGKRVLLRVDLNVPMEGGKVSDLTRLERVAPTIAEIAAVEKINESYVGRVVRLTLLAPDIVEAILEGQQPADLQLEDLLRRRLPDVDDRLPCEHRSRQTISVAHHWPPSLRSRRPTSADWPGNSMLARSAMDSSRKAGLR